jgi:acyl-CoA thioester hydrolase
MAEARTDHHIEKKVYYHDTDAGGVVYYASYLRHLEEGRCEYMRSRGVDVASYAASGIIFPVVRLEVDYKTPARYGDTIMVFTRPGSIGNASISFDQEIRRGEGLILKAKTVWACVKVSVRETANTPLRPVRIPREIRDKIGI